MNPQLRLVGISMRQAGVVRKMSFNALATKLCCYRVGVLRRL